MTTKKGWVVIILISIMCNLILMGAFGYFARHLTKKIEDSITYMQDSK